MKTYNLKKFNPRKALLASVFFVFLGGQNLQAQPASLSFFSMNIQCFTGNWQFRLEQILNQVLVLSPDVISFQEICTTKKGELSQIEFVGKYLTAHGYPLKKVAAQFTHESWGQFNEYIAIYSKINPLAVDQGPLPASILQRGYVAINLNQLWYVNTHLEYKLENATYRQRQIDFLVQRFSKVPHIIGGDFNSAPYSPEQITFRNLSYVSFFPGDTFNGRISESRQIDGMWLSPATKSFIKEMSGGILLNQKVNGQYLSDHFAIQSKLIFVLKKQTNRGR
jgi:endonuclease/exonuclease/phosphatase family metal-dependent hydrolase